MLHPGSSSLDTSAQTTVQSGGAGPSRAAHLAELQRGPEAIGTEMDGTGSTTIADTASATTGTTQNAQSGPSGHGHTVKRMLVGKGDIFQCRYIRPTTFHQGDVRSLYNRPVRLDEDTDGRNVEMGRAGVVDADAEADVAGPSESEGQEAQEGRDGQDGRRNMGNGRQDGQSIDRYEGGTSGRSAHRDMRSRVRSLRHGAAENMHRYRITGTEGQDGEEREEREVEVSDARSRTNGQAGEGSGTRSDIHTPRLLHPQLNGAQGEAVQGTGSRARRLSQHQEAARLGPPVPILQNHSASPTPRPSSPLPSGGATPARSRSGSSGEGGSLGTETTSSGGTRARGTGVPRMLPIRTDTATLRSEAVSTGQADRDGSDSGAPRQMPSQSRQDTLTASALQTPTTPLASYPPLPHTASSAHVSHPQAHSHSQPYPQSQSQSQPQSQAPTQAQPPTPSVSQPTHQIGHWQTYGPGVAPPPYTEQPVFHFPFGRNRGGNDGSSSSPGSGAAFGGSGGGGQGSRALTWAREPTRARRNRDAQRVGGLGTGSGRNSRASSVERDSGNDSAAEGGDDESRVNAAAGPSRLAGGEADRARGVNAHDMHAGQGQEESRQQKEQRMERHRKKGPLEPLGLPSPFAKASKDRVPDFKAGLREGAIGAWAEVREGLKGPIGLPWYWSKEGGVLGLLGGLSYGVLALCPISASIVFLNHSSRGAIRSTRTAHQNRQVAKSSRSRSGTKTSTGIGLPRTGSMDDRSTLRRRDSILSRTASRASVSPTDRTERGERVSMSMTGDELRRAVSIHGTGVSSDEDEGEAIGRGEAGTSASASGHAEGDEGTSAGTGTGLGRTTSRGSRWRLSRRKGKGKARRLDSATAAAATGDGDVEEGTPTNSTLQSSSGLSAAGASTSMSMRTGQEYAPEGSPRVERERERRLTDLEREAKWGNFDAEHNALGAGDAVALGAAVGGSSSGVQGQSQGQAQGRYLSVLERETKLNLFPEVHSASQADISPSVQRSGLSTADSPKVGLPRSPRLDETRSSTAALRSESEGGQGSTPRLELDTKWPVSDSPSASSVLSPESRHRANAGPRSTRPSTMGSDPRMSPNATIQHQRNPSQISDHHEYGPAGRQGNNREDRDGRVSGLEMDTKWQLPPIDTEPTGSRYGGASDALEEKRALERAERVVGAAAARASTGPDRVAIQSFRTNSLGGSGQRQEQAHAKDMHRQPASQTSRMSPLGLMLEAQGETVPRSGEDLPVVQAVDAGVSFHPNTNPQREPQSHGQGPAQRPELYIPHGQARASGLMYEGERDGTGTPPPPLMTPTAYEMDIKWPVPGPVSGPSSPIRERDAAVPMPGSKAAPANSGDRLARIVGSESAASGELPQMAVRTSRGPERAQDGQEWYEARHRTPYNAVRADEIDIHSAVDPDSSTTPEPSPPEATLRTPQLDHRTAPLPSTPHGVNGVSSARDDRDGHGHAPLTKTDTIPSTDLETSTFAGTDPDPDLDSSFTPSQSASQSHAMAMAMAVATGMAMGGKAPSNMAGAGGTGLGMPMQGSVSPTSSSLSPTLLSHISSNSPITPFDVERHYRQGFKRVGYGWTSGFSMGGEGGRRLSL